MSIRLSVSSIDSISMACGGFAAGLRRAGDISRQRRAPSSNGARTAADADSVTFTAAVACWTHNVGSRRRLRGASTSTLVIPSTRRTTLGDRAFPVTAARAWNALPSSVRSAPSLLQFSRDLKRAVHVSVTVLFTI